MLKINLIGKKRREKGKRNWAVVVVIVFYLAFLVYFFGSVINVIYRLNALSSEISVVEQETRLVSSEMLRNNELLNNFVMSKLILEKIQSLNKTRFKYKDYLDEVAKLMPKGAMLKNVDFSNPGWTSVLVSVADLKNLSLLEDQLSDESIMGRSLFASVFTESVVKDKAGGYNLRLQFELRKDARN